MKATFKQVKVVPKTGRFEPELVKGLRNEIDKHKSTAEIELCSLGTSSVTRSEMLRDRRRVNYCLPSSTSREV